MPFVDLIKHTHLVGKSAMFQRVPTQCIQAHSVPLNKFTSETFQKHFSKLRRGLLAHGNLLFIIHSILEISASNLVNTLSEDPLTHLKINQVSSNFEDQLMNKL